MLDDRGDSRAVRSFRDLRELHLHGNGLTGGIAEGFGEMTSLEVLDLGDNRLAGALLRS